MNRVKAIGAVIAFILICCAYTGLAQSNQGKEFWTAYMSHIESTGQSQMSLYITGGTNTTGKVEIADGSYSIPFTVNANEVTTVQIPRSAYLKNQGQFLKGVHITALKSVAVYAHIYASSVSGATLLLPVNALGKNYYSINYTQQSNSETDNLHSYSSFMVIGTEDDTIVEVIPTANLLDGSIAGQVLTLTLKKGEVYQGLALADLTNTIIRTKSNNGDCKRIAVFSGSTKIGIGCREAGFTSDNLFQQVYPTASWGKSYITVPLKHRNYDIFRVILSDDKTNLTVNGEKTYFPVRGLYNYEINSQEPNIITADKPIQVVQYAVSQGQQLNSCQTDFFDLGDPEMIFLTPTEQTLDHVTLYSSPYYGIASHYINVVIKDAQKSTFTLDGKPYTNFTQLSRDPTYAYAQIDVSSGTHNIRAADGFNAIAYGFGQHESYGYAAGASLKNLNQFIALQDNKPNSPTQISGCKDIEYKMQLTLPYATTKIEWDFKNGNPVLTVNNPVVSSTTVKDGKTLYNYEYYKTVKFAVGDYSVTATVINPNGDVCGITTDIDFDFNITDYPDAKFTYAGNCPGEPVQFTDATDAKGSELKTWLWDFGDGKTSSLQNPEHIYAASGDYNVILTTQNINDCSNTSGAMKVHISKPPVALFKVSAPLCADKEVTITDVSAPGDGTIVKWLYDFGDGTTDTRTDKLPFTHLYAATGTYKIKLTLINDKECSSAVAEKSITVSPIPVVAFSLPDVCISDAAKFTDKSTIADNSENGFTYLWNFGDGTANAGNPNTSTAKDPQHRYSVAAVYTVSLTVTSASGCSFTKSQQFTVNGAVPKAIFNVQDKDNLCSSNPVTINEASTVDFGNITKIVLYYDYNGDRQNSETFTKENFPAGHIYRHSYPVFNGPATKTYTIYMEAFSGDACGSATEHDIIIKANPVIQVAQIGSVCREVPPIQIAVNKNGFAGTGVFSGKGVSATGLFSPAAAGVGAFTITYTFTAQNGCDFTTSQDIVVNPTPTVDAGGNTGLLEGGTVLIKAQASGKNLSYKWTPAIGLDHDDVLNPVCAAADDISYTLTVTSSDGCQASDEIFVKVLKKLGVINTFTPNGDGFNDTWTIKYLESYPGNTVDVYNRYGEKVYSSTGYGIPWDGTYKGANLPSGTYYYIINPKNGRKVVSGSVTIIR
ncbi:PKD domain-containing protein [Mucilaginibacter gilvus]|uniref:PKD domain-containing protein n=1 Tax=Mucilaginibacter gilvus TaxID=2305909 RepID=A0A444MPZ5_9SPHI|nr:PKD domain-containing protein [Mucilaginibacter gilvus]RWY53716.1 PKD domain-containing protein [Mucilaginibacter gilvus]